jgi:hypothetical protein
MLPMIFVATGALLMKLRKHALESNECYDFDEKERAASLRTCCSNSALNRMGEGGEAGGGERCGGGAEGALSELSGKEKQLGEMEMPLSCKFCDEDACCRFCFGGPDKGDLIAPCACVGSQVKTPCLLASIPPPPRFALFSTSFLLFVWSAFSCAFSVHTQNNVFLFSLHHASSPSLNHTQLAHRIERVADETTNTNLHANASSLPLSPHQIIFQEFVHTKCLQQWQKIAMRTKGNRETYCRVCHGKYRLPSKPVKLRAKLWFSFKAKVGGGWCTSCVWNYKNCLLSS